MSKNIIQIITKDPKLCIKWFDNKLENPITGRKIKQGGPTFKKLEKGCSSLKKTSTRTISTRTITSSKQKPINQLEQVMRRRKVMSNKFSNYKKVSG